MDEKTGTFCRLSVVGTNESIKVTDGIGNTQYVLTTDPELYNIMTRDYLFDNSDIRESKMIETSSYAVIHRVKDVLYYEKDQINKYKEKVKRLQEQFTTNE